jgi:hypothetical protein
MLCVLCVIPATAVLHHAVFMRPTCMLNGFGPDYSLGVVADWLRHDPSIAWAALLMGLMHGLGRQSRSVRAFAAPLFLAGLPISIWIWDIPFTGRAVCHLGHDQRLALPLLGVVRSMHFYLLGAAIFAPFAAVILARHVGAAARGSAAPLLAGPVARGESLGELRPRPAMPVHPSWPA